MPDFYKLANAHIRDLNVYQPGKPISELQRETGIDDIIKLASNENPLGPSSKAIAAAEQALSRSYRYPDSRCYDLRQALATHLTIDVSRLSLGNGSDNLLAMLIQTFVPADSEVVMSQYSFAPFQHLTLMHQATPIVVPAKQYAYDLDAIQNAITQQTRMILLANPNNPTGSVLGVDALTAFLKKVDENVIVVIDEAYFGFECDIRYPDSVELQNDHPNVITLRTFSKLYGLAGLRLGYSVSHPDIAEILNHVRLPFNTNLIAQAAAIVALEDEEHTQATIRNNNNGITYLSQEFNRLGLEYLPVHANFFTVHFGDKAGTAYQALLSDGIIVRPLVPYKMDEFLRISIGTPAENQRLIAALDKLLPRQA